MGCIGVMSSIEHTRALTNTDTCARVSFAPSTYYTSHFALQVGKSQRGRALDSKELFQKEYEEMQKRSRREEDDDLLSDSSDFESDNMNMGHKVDKSDISYPRSPEKLGAARGSRGRSGTVQSKLESNRIKEPSLRSASSVRLGQRLGRPMSASVARTRSDAVRSSSTTGSPSRRSSFEKEKNRSRQRPQSAVQNNFSRSKSHAELHSASRSRQRPATAGNSLNHKHPNNHKHRLGYNRIQRKPKQFASFHNMKAEISTIEEEKGKESNLGSSDNLKGITHSANRTSPRDSPVAVDSDTFTRDSDDDSDDVSDNFDNEEEVSSSARTNNEAKISGIKQTQFSSRSDFGFGSPLSGLKRRYALQ